MTAKNKLIILTGAVLLGAIAAGSAISAQDKYTVKVPEGLAFSEFRGYEDWQTVAVSVTESSIKAILANPAMIQAYKEGTPGNGKPFPEGSKIAKIEWIKAKNPESPYFVEIPQSLKTVSFIEKDSRRFTDTRGWAYAQFVFDPASETFKPSAPLSATGHACGFACHSAVKAADYIFTKYARR